MSRFFPLDKLLIFSPSSSVNWTFWPALPTVAPESSSFIAVNVPGYKKTTATMHGEFPAWAPKIGVNLFFNHSEIYSGDFLNTQ